MREFIIVIFIFYTSTNLFSQRERSSWKDTTFIPIVLNDTIRDKKVVIVNIGEKAIIYLKFRPLMSEAKENLKNDFIRSDNKKIIRFLNSKSKGSDTIFISNLFDLPHFKYLVTQQLLDGNAKVFYKKEKILVDTIYQRLEKFGEHAQRFFYFFDKRAFFASLEYTGIIEKTELRKE